MHVHHNTLYIRRYHFPYMTIFKQRLTGYFHQCFGPIVRQRLQNGYPIPLQSFRSSKYLSSIFNCIHDKRSSIPASGLTQQIRPMFIHRPLTDKSLSLQFPGSKVRIHDTNRDSLGYVNIRGFRFRFMLPAITHINGEYSPATPPGKVILTGGDSSIAAITFSIPEF